MSGIVIADALVGFERGVQAMQEESRRQKAEGRSVIRERGDRCTILISAFCLLPSAFCFTQKGEWGDSFPHSP
jgi:hypothetical protein